MTKKEFTKILSDKFENEKDMAAIVDSFLDTIKDVLTSGDKISFNGFGTFEVVERNSREGRNPQTGQTMLISAYKTPKFKPSPALKEMVRNS